MNDWKTAALIIGAHLTITVGGVMALNYQRDQAMQAAAAERSRLSRKMDSAWQQRIFLTEQLEKACHR